MAFPSPNEKGKWRAVALEMDIWGFGNTAEGAINNLNELIAIQIEFAAEKKKPSLLDHPTDKKWFELWAILEAIKAAEEERKSKKPAYTLTTSLLPPSFTKAPCYYKAA